MPSMVAISGSISAGSVRPKWRSERWTRVRMVRRGDCPRAEARRRRRGSPVGSDSAAAASSSVISPSVATRRRRRLLSTSIAAARIASKSRACSSLPNSARSASCSSRNRPGRCAMYRLRQPASRRSRSPIAKPSHQVDVVADEDERRAPESLAAIDQQANVQEWKAAQRAERRPDQRRPLAAAETRAGARGRARCRGRGPGPSC